MKNRYYLLVIAALVLVVSSFTKADVKSHEQETSFEIPDSINTIIDQSCYMCHNNDSKNTKAKMKFNFDKLADMSLSKQISKLSKIAKEVKKGDMPPEKFLANYPDKALSDEDEKSIAGWAKSYAKELSD